MQELNSEICLLKSMTTEALDFVDRTENEKIELANTLTSMKKKLKSKQKEVQRRNTNISNFKTKLDIPREKNETDKEAIVMYYEGIVDSLKNQHKLSTDSLQQQLKNMNAIETQKGGKYK